MRTNDRFIKDSESVKTVLRRTTVLMAAVAISGGVVYISNVAKTLSRHGEPLPPLTSDVIAPPPLGADSFVSGTLAPATVPRVTPTQSIFGPSSLSANPVPPPVSIHARELSATPFPSAPLIAGSATDSIMVTKSKFDDH